MGNVVSAGLWIYRSHFKEYLKLALVAHLWLLVPIYGWAKFSYLSALISQLAFEEISDPLRDQENDFKAYRLIGGKPLKINILVTLIVLTAGIVSFLSILVVVFFLAIALGVFTIFTTVEAPEVLEDWVIAFITFLTLAIVPLTMLWAYSHLFIIELVLWSDRLKKSSHIVKRTVKLSRASFSHIQGVMAISFVVTYPISYLIFQISGRGISIVLRFLRVDSQQLDMIGWTLFAIFCLTTSILCMGFWQSIKAVLYYDLLNRRESFNLRLRDR
jgi:sterol desaturase/sphingolipid hydroxylase (fatty acid hydroxylase superfamily)